MAARNLVPEDAREAPLANALTASVLCLMEKPPHNPAMLTFRELDLAQDDDFEQLALHVERLYTELFGAEAVPARSELRRLQAEAATRASSHWAWVARDGASSPAAFFTLAEAFAIFARGRYGIINELWVRPDVRSQGVGALVLDHCRAFGVERGWRRIDVSAPASAKWDRSFEFYEKRGFVPTGRKLKCMLEVG